MLACSEEDPKRSKSKWTNIQETYSLYISSNVSVNKPSTVPFTHSHKQFPDRVVFSNVKLFVFAPLVQLFLPFDVNHFAEFELNMVDK